MEYPLIAELGFTSKAEGSSGFGFLFPNYYVRLICSKYWNGTGPHQDVKVISIVATPRR